MAKDRQDREIAVWSIDLMLGLHPCYRRHLEARIARNPALHLNNRKLLKCHLDRLAEPYALEILAVVWRRYCGKAAGRKAITRHALGKALEASSAQQLGVNRWPKFLRRASRVVEAAITYGLIVEEKGRLGCAPNCKLLHGTKRLDELMVPLGLDFGAQVRKSFLYGGKKLCSPPNVKKRKGASKR